MLNVCIDRQMIDAAKRTIEKLRIKPLFYDAFKAQPSEVSFEQMYNGLIRAHDYSGIGQISNNLTKLWNKDDIDIDAAKWLTFYNNQVD